MVLLRLPPLLLVAMMVRVVAQMMPYGVSLLGVVVMVSWLLPVARVEVEGALPPPPPLLLLVVVVRVVVLLPPRLPVVPPLLVLQGLVLLPSLVVVQLGALLLPGGVGLVLVVAVVAPLPLLLLLGVAVMVREMVV